MVKLNKIYTRTGDDGTTGLVGGDRVKKCTARVDAYGTVDEAGAAIGMVRVHLKHDAQGHHFDDMLKRIQHDLFDLGADLATPYADGSAEDNALRIIDTQVARLEAEIDAMNQHLAPLTSFILAGGTVAAAELHLARTIVRRAERITCTLAEAERVNPLAVHYLNRLSDHLFVMARAVNNNGAADVLWEPGVNR